MSVRPGKTQISMGIRPVWSESSLSAWRKLGSLATHWMHSEDWSDSGDAQADLSLRRVHIHFVDFVMSRLKWWGITDDMSCSMTRLAWASTQSGQSSLCTLRVAKDPTLPDVDSKDWSNWPNAQADLSVCWVLVLSCCDSHVIYVTFLATYLKKGDLFTLNNWKQWHCFSLT